MLHFAYGIANEDIIYFREGIPRVFGCMLFIGFPEAYPLYRIHQQLQCALSVLIGA